MAPKEKESDIYNVEKPISTVGIKYINHKLQFLSPNDWLDGRRKDDNLEGLWRIHDRLYDLDSFIKKHPGGPEWLRITKGTDITEAFETHHVKGVAEQLLSRYFVKEATTPRNSPFTFNQNGFYKTLKEKVAKELPNIPKHAVQQSKVFADIIVASYLVLCILATYFESFLLGILAGYFLTLTVNISHNFLHQKDNFRMYYFDLSMMSSREFRISHALSHHLFPNTIHDMEISMFDPALLLLPKKKTQLRKYLSWLSSFLLFPTITMKGYFDTLLTEKKLRINTLIPWISLLCTYFMTSQDLTICLKMFVWIIFWGSLIFGLIGKTAAHHHPEIFHDGDTARPADELDFGVHQLDAVSDRPNITGSLFLVLTNYGDHALHHLFPTLDHGVLDSLYPTFLQTCIDFGVDWKLYSSGELVVGALQQLARDKPNSKPPQPLKKKN
ncbi:hypothetical protein HHI36_014077 [Cryptolaemus montrouzieri]|uniref:Cytochrome b5-related protein n=1 Tax=Cryptolaemus montrouzieri TaxID=559131 RepID=A0ABD2N1U5_9CUCU